ncbi:MAG: MucR family transcriptional regulator [Nitrospirota bacterium]|nr:MucR family transcriptional regulator [Nitrospirota bacterium]
MSEQLEQTTLAELTADIVSAYVAHNSVAVSDVSQLIGTVAGKLAGLEADEAESVAAAQKPVPAVPVRRSIGEDHLLCLLCGQPQKILKRHLAKGHDLTPADYREMFGLKSDYPMIPPAYKAMRSEIAKKIGLGRPKKAPARRTKPAPKRTK